MEVEVLLELKECRENGEVSWRSVCSVFVREEKWNSNFVRRFYVIFLSAPEEADGCREVRAPKFIPFR